MRNKKSHVYGKNISMRIAFAALLLHIIVAWFAMVLYFNDRVRAFVGICSRSKGGSASSYLLRISLGWSKKPAKLTGFNGIFSDLKQSSFRSDVEHILCSSHTF